MRIWWMPDKYGRSKKRDFYLYVIIIYKKRYISHVFLKSQSI